MDTMGKILALIVGALVLDVVYYYATGDMATAEPVGQCLVILGMACALLGSFWAWMAA